MTLDTPNSLPDRTVQAILRCRTVAAGTLRHLNYVRDLPPIPVEERLGPPGDATVATPSETLLAALGSCLGARIQANAASASIVVRSLELDVEMDVTNNSMWAPRGGEPEPVGFETIRITVRVDALAPVEVLRALVAHAVLWSPVANTLHSPVHLDVTTTIPLSATVQRGGGRDANAEPSDTLDASP